MKYNMNTKLLVLNWLHCGISREILCCINIASIDLYWIVRYKMLFYLFDIVLIIRQLYITFIRLLGWQMRVFSLTILYMSNNVLHSTWITSDWTIININIIRLIELYGKMKKKKFLCLQNFNDVHCVKWFFIHLKKMA